MSVTDLRDQGAAAGFYREYQPAPDLLPYVACTWIRVPELAQPQLLTPIIPDGCADIMIYDDEPPQVAGPDTITRWVQLAHRMVIVGIRLRPGAVRLVLGCPADAIADRSVRLGDITRSASRFHERLRSATDLHARRHLLSNDVRVRIQQASIADLPVIVACRALAIEPRLEMDTLARRLNWNARTMRRRFIAACGYGPKHFQRIMRLQSAIHAMQEARPPSLVSVAVGSGYADQAHMTRDFRSITGFTPTDYIATAPAGLGTWTPRTTCALSLVKERSGLFFAERNDAGGLWGDR